MNAIWRWSICSVCCFVGLACIVNLVQGDSDPPLPMGYYCKSTGYEKYEESIVTHDVCWFYDDGFGGLFCFPSENSGCIDMDQTEWIDGVCEVRLYSYCGEWYDLKKPRLTKLSCQTVKDEFGVIIPDVCRCLEIAVLPPTTVGEGRNVLFCQ